MADRVTFVSRAGSVTFDFDQKKIIFDRAGALAETVGLVSMEISMEEITDIECWPPKMLTFGGFNLIVNHVRYVAKADYDATSFSIPDKKEFPAMQNALQRVLTIAGLSRFKANKEVNAPKEAYIAPKEEGVVFSLTNNTGSSLLVFDDHLILKHGGVLNYLSKNGLKGEKRINFPSISTIEFRKATTMAAGFIQFSVMGAGIGGGLNAAAGDENSILFDAAKNNFAQQIVDYIEKRRVELSSSQAPQIVQTVSAADELKKFKELLDCGIITQEEFNAKKKQLLGL